MKKRSTQHIYSVSFWNFLITQQKPNIDLNLNWICLHNIGGNNPATTHSHDVPNSNITFVVSYLHIPKAAFYVNSNISWLVLDPAVSHPAFLISLVGSASTWAQPLYVYLPK